MVRSLPLDVQNNIKSLLKSGHPYSSIIRRVPGVKKSTISDYKRRWFPNMRPLNSGRKSEITATTKSYIRRSVITGPYQEAQAVFKGYSYEKATCMGQRPQGLDKRRLASYDILRRD
ncbi:hypothetical protein G6F51_014265 [Rhizopus arrhizus]|uniref:Uncharacterized protein n=1 Tax=Rhizopus oryzae TaxID=64495 RepID=A0A9P6XMW6_RHIOR|nr:hypothetical protein G6F51_014265 [Rhizopus arrhizus]